MTDQPAGTPPAPTRPVGRGGRGGGGFVAWWRRFSHSRHVSAVGIFLLGVAILLFGLLLVYALVKVWPALQSDAKTPDPSKATEVSLFHQRYKLTPEKALMLVVILAGALGSFLHVATSFSDYVGNRRLMRSWIWFYILRPLVGAGLALLFYFAVRGGLFTTQAGSSDLNPYGMAALAALVGLFSKQATNKLQQIFDTAFAVPQGYGDDARSDSIGNPLPTLVSATPPQLTVNGDLKLGLAGTGFIRDSVVSVTRADGTEVSRTATVVDGQTLDVTLDAEDVAAPGMLAFTVVNPAPGGGTSNSLVVEVAPPTDPAATGGTTVVDPAAGGAAPPAGGTVYAGGGE